MSRAKISARLKDRSRLLLLVGVMALVAVAIGGVSILTLYQVSMDAEKARLVGMARAQAGILGAMARYDEQLVRSGHPGGERDAAMAQVLDAFEHYQGFGESGEFVLAERGGGEISFLYSRRRSGSLADFRVPWGSELAGPMRLALSGESGTVLALDYAGIRVLSAYEPVAELGLGFVAKIDLAEVRRPFIEAAMLGTLGGAVILLIGAFLFRQINAPILLRQEAEAQYRLLLESTAEAIYGVDLSGNCTFVNPACLRMLGYEDQSDLLGRNMHVLMHHTRPDGSDYPMNECRIYRAFREGKGAHVDNEVLWRADGSSFPAEYWSHPIKKNGTTIGSVVTFLDITERRQAEEFARREEARLAGILDLAVEAVVSVGEDQRIQIFNTGAEVVFGYTAAEVIGKPIGMLLPMQSRSAHGDHMSSFKQTGRPRRMGSARSEITGLRKDGSEFPAEASISRIEVGGELLFTATLHDLTERKEAEAALRKSEASLANAQRIAHIGSWEWDILSDKISWSDENFRIFDLAPQEITPTYEIFTKYIHPDDRARVDSAVRAALDEGQRYLIDHRIVLANDVVKILRERGEVYRDTLGEPIRMAGTVQDITEQRGTEMQLRQAQKMEAVGQLTSGIAHDFNNILAVVLGNLEFAVERTGQGKDSSKQLDLALQAAERGADLNRRLLAFSRNQVMESRPTDIGSVIESMADLLERALGEKIELVTSLPPELPKAVIDSAQLESAILNLAINARDAMPDGGVVGIKAAVVAAGKRRAGGKEICITFWDTGTGMTEEVRERAMEPFFTTKEVGQGSGLGLSMVYNFAEHSGGEMKISSEAGGGTIVELLLPIEAGEDAEDEEALAAQDLSSANGKHTILVVEDQMEVREIVVANLEFLGYRVRVADDGRGALATLDEHDDIDLMLSDMVMPGMSGEEVVIAARAVNPALRCVFMSGFAEKGSDPGQPLSTEIRILRKPFTRAVLARTIREALNEA